VAAPQELDDEPRLDHEFTNPLAGDQTLIDGESRWDISADPGEGV
jgi:hypothetical protein